MAANNAHPDHGFKQALHNALVETTRNVTRARNCDHLLYNIDLSVAPSSTELELMYQKRLFHFLSICSFAIPYQSLDGTEGMIPVTPPYQSVECQTFHTITIQRHTDGATVVVLVREPDNYIVAVRVFLNEQEACNAQWLKFKDVQLPQRFQNVVEMDYDSAYETILDINFGKNTLSQIVEFLMSLRMKPSEMVTEHGKLLFGSLFLLLGEAQRFRSAQNWILRTSQCDMPEKIPENIADIFRRWSHLSKTCFEFYFAIREAAKFGLNISGDAILSLRTTEAAHKRANTVLKFRFRDPQNKFCLSCLVGGELLLLKHDYDWCTRIAMRLAGYGGDLNMKNYNIRRRHGRDFEN